MQDTTKLDQAEKNLTVSYSLPMDVVRAIEYRAYRDRTNKSEAVARLVRQAVEAEQQPAEPLAATA